MIETNRLILRKATTLDTEKILGFVNSAYAKKYNPYDSYSEIRLWKHLRETTNFVLICKETKSIIGIIGLEEDTIRINVNAISLTYIIDELYSNKGYMTEALKEIIRYVFEEENIDIISLKIISSNLSSIAIAKKLGFIKEGIIRKAIKSFDNIIYDQVIYSMTKKEYEENQLI